MGLLEIRNLSFSYPNEKELLKNINLIINEGDFIVLTGASGCGKSTLLKLLKKEVAPIGQISGEILYKNKKLEQWLEADLIQEIGIVMQNPEAQIIMDEVFDELIFAMENLQVPHKIMKKKIAELVTFFGLENLLDQQMRMLSGGQKQLINLMSNLMLEPSILLLDEPTSQLDPLATKELLAIIERLNKEMGITVIMVEHALNELYTIADRIIIMDDGQIINIEAKEQLIHWIYQENRFDLLPYLPDVARFYMTVTSKPNEPIPFSVKDARRWLKNMDLQIEPSRAVSRVRGNELLALKNVHYQYEKDQPAVLKSVSLSIYENDFMAIIGGNGAGKTTLLKACIGSYKPTKGSIKLAGSSVHKIKVNHLKNIMGFLPQNPLTYFMADTIYEELLQSIDGLASEYHLQDIDDLTELLQIKHILNRHPHDCSGGELQRAALACILCRKPKLLFIDEPTKGLDVQSKMLLGELLERLNKEGMTIVMVTHDLEFAADFARQSALLFKGEIAVEDETKKMLKGNYFYTTNINQLTRNQTFPECFTLKEALNYAKSL